MYNFRSPLLKQNLSDLYVSVGDIQVSPSSKVRDLCVVFDQYLTFHDHISGICKSTHFHLRGIGRIRNLLTFDATAQLIHALITSRLDLCNSILYNLPNKHNERHQSANEGHTPTANHTELRCTSYISHTSP